MSEKISKYKQELKQLHETSKEAERKAKAEQESFFLNFRFFIETIILKMIKAKVRQLADTKKKLDDMKRQKVEMIKKMKDEAKVAREKEKEARKEIIQMKKTMRQTESLGQSLLALQ